MSEFLPSGPISQSGDMQLQAWQEPRYPAPQVPKSPLERPMAAIRRYKWLIIAIVLASIGLGAVATRLLTPQYEVQARVMVTSDMQADNRTGPVRAPGLLTVDDWGQLLKTFVISDEVVRKLSLYLKPATRTDAPMFKGFTLGGAPIAGSYELTIDKARKHWALSARPSDVVVDSGAVTDSVGRALGFRWQVPAIAFEGSGVAKVRFTISTPRETSARLLSRLGVQRGGQESSFLTFSLQDSDRQLAATILNTWVTEFMHVASDLKTQKLSGVATTLQDQVHTAKGSLDSAEFELQALKIRTITLPSENTPIAPGVSETRDPVMKEYFNRKIEYEDIRRDVQQLRSLIKRVATDSVPSDALLDIRSAPSTSPVVQALRNAVTEYHTARANLATQRNNYTDEFPAVKAQIAALNELKTQRIPQLANELLASLRIREVEDSVRVAGADKEMKAIPERTIQEEQLLRRRNSAATLYADLQNRFAIAQLAEASATPDVRVMDTAIAPLHPTKNTAPVVMLMAVVGGLGAALGLAILLDTLDGKLRYPEQVTDELGLPIAGTVPRFPKSGVNQNSPEQMFQLVESFRTLRMSVASANGEGPISVAVSSPSPSEGKSLISANLAMSFADAGLRTVLVDGDTRRGALHEMFEVRSSPGLTDYLIGNLTLNDVLRPTAHEALTVLTCGTRRRRSPELLTSPQLVALVADLRSRFDVVIFDTPPLAAGIDGYSISSATGSLLVVLRVGQTQRRMAGEKLRMFERLPVNVIGAVLNGIQPQGEYGYYGYVSGYEARDEEPPGTSVVPVKSPGDLLDVSRR